MAVPSRTLGDSVGGTDSQHGECQLPGGGLKGACANCAVTLGQNWAKMENGVFFPALTERWRKQERERVDCSHIRGVCRHAEDTYFHYKTMKKWILHNRGPLMIHLA